MLLAPGVRILVARYYHEKLRPKHPTLYLFPSDRNASEPVSARFIWSKCRVVFERCGLSGDHVHPHTFRHTVVQILYMRGRSFEQIAKWIGHSNPSITSGVYGRLSSNDTDRMIADDGGGAQEKEEWQRVYNTCKLPVQYHFESWELRGVCPEAVTAQSISATSSKRAALAYRGNAAVQKRHKATANPEPTKEQD